jgi:hypothetical protein
MRNKINILLTILLAISILMPPCMAKNILVEQVTIKSIAPSPYYDSKPSVWGDNIVWRRAVNQNSNTKIELSEPSWIMIYNIKDNEAYNITPVLTFVWGDKYDHAEAPEIYGNKVIYEAQISGNSSDTRLFMYDINSKDTIQIPLLSTTNSHGHLHLIYDTWIVYTDIQNNKRQAYMYNYETGAYRTIIGKGDTHTVYGAVMDGTSIILTIADVSGEFEIWNYDIYTSNIKILMSSNTILMATSIYENVIGITELNDNKTMWQASSYNLLTNETVQFKNNTNSLIISSTYFAFESNGTLILSKRIINNETDIIEIKSYSTKYIGDIYENTLVWMENSNTNVSFGNAKDDFDIYVRTVITVEQMVIDGIWFVISIIGVILIIIAAGIKYRYNIYGD